MNAKPARIHHGLTYQQYVRLPGWRWSVIKRMDQSPLHVQYAQQRQGQDRDSTSDQDMRRAMHCLVLEPERFGDQFSVFDGVRNANHRKYQAHLACFPDTTALNPREHGTAKRAAEAIRTHPLVAPLLTAGRSEVSITWTDEATGLPCKARIDWLRPGLFFDLKDLGTTSERIVARRTAQLLYHGQAAHYADGLRANGMPDLAAYLVVTEGKGAQDVGVFELSPGAPDGALHVGATKRAEFMARLAGCVDRNEWPGRHEGVVDLVLPTYALLDAEPDDLSEAASDTDETDDPIPWE